MQKYLHIQLRIKQIYWDSIKSHQIRNQTQKQRMSKIRSSSKVRELTCRISEGMMVSRIRLSPRDKRHLRSRRMICYKSLENHLIEGKIKMSSEEKLMTVQPQCTIRRLLKSKTNLQDEGKQDNPCKRAKSVRVIPNISQSNRTVKSRQSSKINLNIQSACKTTTSKFTHYRQKLNRQAKALTDLRGRIRPQLRDKIQ